MIEVSETTFDQMVRQLKNPTIKRESGSQRSDVQYIVNDVVCAEIQFWNPEICPHVFRVLPITSPLR